jgi:hypothetical protein
MSTATSSLQEDQELTATLIFVKGGHEFFSTQQNVTLIRHFGRDALMFSVGYAVQSLNRMNGGGSSPAWDCIKIIGISQANSYDGLAPISREEWEASPNKRASVWIAEQLQRRGLTL